MIIEKDGKLYQQLQYRESVLKKNYNTEYQELVKKYSAENIHLIKETTFAFQYICYIYEEWHGWDPCNYCNKQCDNLHFCSLKQGYEEL